ncbi:hypothetical protein HID58_065411 [Brassica napus]|uniref:AMP-dependent synthetase/ligase domain-containing protein n=1 Tax=Brassica napus TaxID=3708 RepID=A0ABQ7ZD85_BRANA|nr:hypothetical protein HID58_065411 [Brassica napus]
MEGTMKSTANYVPLTPISFLIDPVVYADRTSVVYGPVTYTWRQTRDRCVRVASALSQLGISSGDVVRTFLYLWFRCWLQTCQLWSSSFRCSHGWSFALYHSHPPRLRTRIRFAKQLRDQSVFADHQFLQIAQGACEILSKKGEKVPLLVLIQEPSCCFGEQEEVDGVRRCCLHGKSNFQVIRPKDECDAISLNYTSGTTSSPKGVVYSHRGAYLNSLATVLLNEMHSSPTYLWTNPMFHCNRWCLIWGVTAIGGSNICLRNVTAKGIFDNICQHKVTHMGGAPTILNMIVNASDSEKTASGEGFLYNRAAPPPAHVIKKMEELGFSMFHSYGLTETYGPGTVCAWKPEWDLLPSEEQAKMKARQGVNHIGIEEVAGNTVMNGYLKNPEATKVLSKEVGFGVETWGKHPDGYIELKEAVVARPDEYWGKLPHYMAPRSIVFEDLPKTSTGKVQKFVLRTKAMAMGSLSKKGTSKL